MLPLKRQELILQELQENRFVQVKTLAKDLNVSELTIRRDLDILGTKGLLERTHGGASLKLNLNLEPEYEQKMSKFPTEKKAIGLKAASLVKDGDIVMVNSGTTTAEVLRAIIQSRKAVTIITNNID
ncbi:MAG: DeoR/GlpR transcriptional regulator, partial [Sphaerochaetaceae bacterium]|nr:DeoR/GlpR transcriptional regulator [Sphaerochaetaceae bacterium]